MTSEPRIVFDASSVVSGFLKLSSTPAAAYRLAKACGQVLVSKATLTELEDVLRRPKFDRYLSLDARMAYLAELANFAELVEITESITACRDPKDDKYLELAVCGRATHLITGDADLLVLHPFRGVAILTPAAFVDLLKPA